VAHPEVGCATVTAAQKALGQMDIHPLRGVRRLGEGVPSRMTDMSLSQRLESHEAPRSGIGERFATRDRFFEFCRFARELLVR